MKIVNIVWKNFLVVFGSEWLLILIKEIEEEKNQSLRLVSITSRKVKLVREKDSSLNEIPSCVLLMPCFHS